MSNIFAWNDKENLAVVYSNGTWVTIDTSVNDVIGQSKNFSFSEDDGWVTTLPNTTANSKKLQICLELADSATSSLVVTESDDATFSYKKSFRVPNAVKAEGKFTEDTATLREIYDYSRNPHFNLRSNPEPPFTLAWIRNIKNKHPLSKRALAAAGFIPDPKSVYFGVPVDEDTLFIMTGLVQFNESTEEWSVRNPEHWDPIHENDLPGLLVELDPDSASQLAMWIDGADERSSDTIEFSFADALPEESALFFAAEAELDMELLDRVFDIYDSTERSVNAKKQVRGPGGKFGPGGKTTPENADPVVKARLPYSLPIVTDVAALIAQYLADVAKQRVKGQETPDESFAVSADAAGIEVTDVTPLYLAIVDDIDPDAVLDVIAIVPPKRGAQGDVSAWKRDNGQWINAPEILQQLRGSTPPSVVKLEEPDLVKNVLAQVDKSTATEAEETPAPGATEVTPEGDPVPEPVVAAATVNIDRERAIKEGLSLPDGSYPIRNKEDLKRAVKAFGRAKDKAKTKKHIKKRARALKATDLLPDTWNTWDIVRGYAYIDGSLNIHDVDDLLEAIELAVDEDQEAHIVKRARALNRLDLIPHGWNTFESPETELWGPFGELVAAGGADRNRGNAERLRRYWLKGPGAAKIRWGTPGDWKRCVSNLSKYLGPRAKGYCQLRHIEANGYATGDKRNL
jgi:hypothetical protein